jgi:hypothetical protein
MKAKGAGKKATTAESSSSSAPAVAAVHATRRASAIASANEDNQLSKKRDAVCFNILVVLMMFH